MENKKRSTPLEEQLSNTLNAVDKLHADVETFKDYAVENNKVVNSMLRKLDDHSEQFEKVHQEIGNINGKLGGILGELAADRKLRDAQFDLIMRKFEHLESSRN